MGFSIEILQQNCRDFPDSTNQPGLPRQLKTHIAFQCFLYLLQIFECLVVEWMIIFTFRGAKVDFFCPTAISMGSMHQLARACTYMHTVNHHLGLVLQTKKRKRIHIRRIILMHLTLCHCFVHKVFLFQTNYAC